jgi:CBS domain-containing protein
MTVASAMSRNVQTCNSADPVSAAEEVMKLNRVRRVPVVDSSNHLVGILSLNDLALAAAHNGRTKRSQVAQEEVAEILASVCEHRDMVPAIAST